jgi:hypothetical protein
MAFESAAKAAFDPVGIGVHSSGSVYDAISIRIEDSVSRWHVRRVGGFAQVLGIPISTLIR